MHSYYPTKKSKVQGKSKKMKGKGIYVLYVVLG